MVNYEEILLKKIKPKADRLMERISADSDSVLNTFEENGKYRVLKLSETPYEWVRSFFTGIVTHLYVHCKDEKYAEFLESKMQSYTDYIYSHLDEISHDTGFLYSLYAVAYYKATGNENARNLALKAADELSKRHHYESGIIQAFCRVREKRPMTIIDDMMNLALIMWAGKETGHMYYEKIYTSHIQTTINDFMRDDYTFRHAFSYDYATGKPLGERNYCGYACGSTWARGQMWALYGFVNALDCTLNGEQYVPVITGILNRLSILLPEDGIPNWDLMLHGKNVIKDTSAALIFACAVKKLQLLNKNHPEIDPNGDLQFSGAVKTYEIADRVLETIVEKYLAPEQYDNIVTGAQCGSDNKGCLWGDYFFTELVMRKLYGDKFTDFWI